MTDNATADPGSGGVTFGTDDIGGVHFPRTKLIHGADGTNDGDVSSTNPLPVALPNKIDSNNSSTSTLTSGSSFTGTGTDVTNYRNVLVSVFADQDSATDGLKIQFSSDNSNWDFEEDFTISASSGETHLVPVMAQYFRVVYTNGGTGQTAFRLQSVLSTDDLTGTVANLNSGVGGLNQALLTRSVLVAFDGSAYTNIQATNGGNLKISLQEVSDGLDVGAGNAGGETQRVSIATDDVNLSAIKTAVEAQPDSHYRNVDANAEAAIKGSAGTLYWIHAINLTASIAYLHLYDATTGNVTPGSTTPDFTFPIPTQGDTNGAGFNLSFGPGHAFANAITLVVTTTIDGSAGDPGTNGVMVNAGYS